MMKTSILKQLFTFFFFALVSSLTCAQVSISGFAPLSGPVGTTVVISGNNFNTTPSANIVRFGIARATVTSATANSLTVKVPRGAASSKISVMTAQLAAYSSTEFLVTSVNCNLPVTDKSFGTVQSFTAGRGSWGIAKGDIDGDGKIDIAYPNYENNVGGQDIIVSILKNTSDVGNISLAPPIHMFSGTYPDDVLLEDFDGDGKLDMASINNDANNPICVWRNLSTPGNIMLSARLIINYGISASKLSAGDIDNDGKKDIIVSYGGGINILKNTSSLGNLQFAPPVLITAAFEGFVSVGDLDGDGLSEIVSGSGSTSNLSIFKNISTASAIAFAAPVILVTSTRPMGVALADIDRDGKMDIVNVHFNTLLHIHRNTSTAGNISFAPRFDYNIGATFSYTVATDDVDGDTKPDIILRANGLGFIRNLSTPGNLVLAPLINFPVPSSITVTTADMDNDGKQDLIAMAGGTDSKLSIVRNKMCEEVSLCPDGNNSITANITGDTYQWQLNDGTGFTNLSDNTNYAGTGTRTLQLMNIPLGFYDYKYRCLVDGIPTSATSMRFENTWAGTINNSWENPGNWTCLVLPDANTDVIIPAGNIILNTSTTIRSLTAINGANVTVVAGNVLTINH